MKGTKKLLSLLLSLALAVSLAAPALAAEENAGDVVVLYTNDVHTYIDNNVGEGNENGLTYSKVAGYRDTLENVLLVDAGDHIQGTAYGSMDAGATIVELMNAAGYDLATLGNHEFDTAWTAPWRSSPLPTSPMSPATSTTRRAACGGRTCWRATRSLR